MAKLLDIAKKERGAEVKSKTKEACRKFLGGEPNDELLTGLVSLVNLTASLKANLDEMVLTHSPENASDSMGP